jgi:hypothetical protein
MPTGIGSGGSSKPLTLYSIQYEGANNSFVQNQVSLGGLSITAAVTFQNIVVSLGGTGDLSHNYDIGLYNQAGALVANIGAQGLNANGATSFSTVQGSQTIQPGPYAMAWTTAAASPTVTLSGGGNLLIWIYNTSYTTSTGGALPANIGALAVSPTTGNLYAAIFN